MTLEQKRALALARARLRLQASSSATQLPIGEAVGESPVAPAAPPKPPPRRLPWECGMLAGDAVPLPRGHPT